MFPDHTTYLTAITGTIFSATLSAIQDPYHGTFLSTNYTAVSTTNVSSQQSNTATNLVTYPTAHRSTFSATHNAANTKTHLAAHKSA